MRRREEPVVMRMEVDSEPTALGREHSTARELPLVRGEREERDRRRTALADLETLRARLALHSVAKHLTESIHALDAPGCLELLQTGESRRHRYTRGEVRAREKYALGRRA